MVNMWNYGINLKETHQTKVGSQWPLHIIIKVLGPLRATPYNPQLKFKAYVKLTYKYILLYMTGRYTREVCEIYFRRTPSYAIDDLFFESSQSSAARLYSCGAIVDIWSILCLLFTVSRFSGEYREWAFDEWMKESFKFWERRLWILATLRQA